MKYCFYLSFVSLILKYQFNCKNFCRSRLLPIQNLQNWHLNTNFLKHNKNLHEYTGYLLVVSILAEKKMDWEELKGYLSFCTYYFPNLAVNLFCLVRGGFQRSSWAFCKLLAFVLYLTRKPTKCLVYIWCQVWTPDKR